MKDDFFQNWHSFGSRLYRYENGRWIPTTEEIFAVELERYNSKAWRRRAIKTFFTRIPLVLVGVVLGRVLIWG